MIRGTETTLTRITRPTDQSIDVLDRYLEGCLERVLRNTPLARPAELLKLIPAGVPETHHPLLLIEMIKMDMSVSCESGTMLRIEDYIAELSPPLSPRSVSLDLVMEERELLRSIGKEFDESIAGRFPHLSGIGMPIGRAIEATSTAFQTRPPEPIVAGQTIDDFLIVGNLGSGAFAHVYLARQISMQRLVALKVSRGGGGESQTLAQLDHPNIVRVFDQRAGVMTGSIDPDAADDGTCHLLYMQYVPGGTLAGVVKRVRDVATPTGDLLLQCVDGQLLKSAQQVPERSSVRDWLSQASWASVVAWIGIQLARALDEAHANDVLHRDVKPANVLLSAEGIPKLADFNVSFAGVAGRAGAAANFGGSIAYMAPEHLKAVSATDATAPGAVGPSADLYSLGVLLWELWQGRRPFQVPQHATSWTEMLSQQLESRRLDLAVPVRGDDPSERVLEAALRRTLDHEVAERVASGNELAARLKLALHPEIADIFDPPPTSGRARLLQYSPRTLAAIVILTPNIAAGVFNYFYNQEQIISRYVDREPSFESAFKLIALVVNLIAFPGGAAMMLWFTQPIVTAMRQVRAGKDIPSTALDDSIQLSQRAAIIGGLLWVIAGAVYPVTLRILFPSFDRVEAIHFFMSLLICGGVAAVYPFFGMAWLATKIYYPRFQRDRLSDDQFQSRASLVARRCGLFLLAAAVIPLIGLVLLISRDVVAKDVMLWAVLASVAGLFAAFYAFGRIIGDWQKMSVVLGNPTQRVVPAADQVV